MTTSINRRYQIQRMEYRPAIVGLFYRRATFFQFLDRAGPLLTTGLSVDSISISSRPALSCFVCMETGVGKESSSIQRPAVQRLTRHKMTSCRIDKISPYRRHKVAEVFQETDCIFDWLIQSLYREISESNP